MLQLYKETADDNQDIEQIMKKKNIGKNLINIFSDNHLEFTLKKEVDGKQGNKFTWGNN